MLPWHITSAAMHVDAQQKPSEVNAYIPPELVPISKGGQIILSAADNWDHNERTVDSKKTTHGMTSILVQMVSTESPQSLRIKREPDRTLDTTKLQGKHSPKQTFTHFFFLSPSLVMSSNCLQQP